MRLWDRATEDLQTVRSFLALLSAGFGLPPKGGLKFVKNFLLRF